MQKFGLLLTGEDTFFLTILGTWLSVRINTWGDSHYFALLCLIMGILSFQLLIVQFRHFLSGFGNPEYSDQRTTKSRNRTAALSFLILVIIALYFSWKNTSYLQWVDIYIFTGVATMWLFFPFVVALSGIVGWVSKLVKGKVTSDVPSVTGSE